MSFENREITTFESRPISLKPLSFSSVRQRFRAFAPRGETLPMSYHRRRCGMPSRALERLTSWLPVPFPALPRMGTRSTSRSRRRLRLPSAEPSRPVNRPLQPLTAELVEPRTPADSPHPLKHSHSLSVPPPPFHLHRENSNRAAPVSSASK